MVPSGFESLTPFKKTSRQRGILVGGVLENQITQRIFMSSSRCVVLSPSVEQRLIVIHFNVYAMFATSALTLHDCEVICGRVSLSTDNKSDCGMRRAAARISVETSGIRRVSIQFHEVCSREGSEGHALRFHTKWHDNF